jgi:hypothetical protein
MSSQRGYGGEISINFDISKFAKYNHLVNPLLPAAAASVLG